MRDVVEYNIMSGQGLSTATFTAATTDICTANAHGLENGDPVTVSSATTLPAGLTAGVVYYVIEETTNTFKLSATRPATYTTGSVASPPVPVVNITDTGTGAHTFVEHDIGKNIFCGDFKHITVHVAMTGTANLTFKFVGGVFGDSVADPDSCPDFSAAQSVTNMWDTVDSIDLETGTAVDGDTGFSPSAADDNRHFEINTNHLEWFNVKITAWTAGALSVVVKLSND